MMDAASLRSRAIVMLVNGLPPERVVDDCVRNGADHATAEAIVGEAREQITVTAEFSRKEKVGVAIRRCEDLYAKSVAARDTRTALQAQREINRLLSLYTSAHDSPAGPTVDAETLRRLDVIAGYLLPLGLTDESYPVEEHARLAAEVIRANGLCKV